VKQKDKQLLIILQKELPLVSKPFLLLAKRLNIPEKKVLNKAKMFISKGTITRIGAVFNSNSLGYKSTLVAMKVPEEKLNLVIPIINQLKGVSHNYLRDNEYNLWFTISGPSETSLKKIINRLKMRTGIKDFLNLKIKKMFKIDTSFSTGSKINQKRRKISRPIQLTAKDKKLINRLSKSIPLTSLPFKKIGEDLGLKEEEVLNKISNWLRQGIIRRFSAIVRPTKIGLEGAALGVWRVNRGKIDEVGKLMAEFPQVSHCYQRVIYPEWRYNLYTMIHGKDKNDCQKIAERISVKTGISEYKLLFTLKEIKKESLHYFEA